MKHKAKQLLTKPSFSHARFSRTNLIAFIIVFAVIGGYILLHGHAATGTANIFVASTGNDSTCTRSTSLIAFGSAAGHICATPQKACTLGQSGDTVIIEDGTYNGDFSGCTGHQSYANNIVFMPEPGHACPMTYPNVPDPWTITSCSVNLNNGSVDDGANLQGSNGDKTCGVTGHPLPDTLTPAQRSGWVNHITIQGMNVGAFFSTCSAYIELDNDVGSNWYVGQGAYNWTINGGVYCCRTDAQQPTQGDSTSTGADWPPMENFTVENAVISDFMTFGSSHGDGFFTDPSYNVHLIKNVLARNDCIPVYSNYAQGSSTAVGIHGYWVIGNVVHAETVHNGGGQCGQSISLGDDTSSMGMYDSIIAFNSIEGPIDKHTQTRSSNIRVIGNITDGLNMNDDTPGCGPAVTALYNIVLGDNWGDNCGSSTNILIAPQQYISYDSQPNSQTSNQYFTAPLGDYRLKSGVAAISKVPVSWCSTDSSTQAVCAALSTDINGNPRPATGYWDAGAYQTTQQSTFNCYGADSSCYTPNACTTTITSGLDAAITNAAAGSTICLRASGSPYAAISNTYTKSSDVTIQPYPGEAVTLNGVSLLGGTNHVVFQGFTIAGASTSGITNSKIIHSTFTGSLYVCEGTTCGGVSTSNANLTFDYDRFDGINTALYDGRVTIRGQDGVSGTVSGITVSHSHFGAVGSGHSGCTDGIFFNGNGGAIIGPGNEFSGFSQGNCDPAGGNPDGAHVDPIQFYGEDNAIITGNWFHDNNDSSGGLESFNDDGDTTVTNNVFNCTCSYPYSVAAMGGDNWNVSHNTFVGGGDLTFQVSATASSGNTATNNAWINGGSIITSSGWGTASYNLNSGIAGTGSITGTPIFAGGSSPTTYAGYALASNSPGYNAGSDGLSMGISALYTGSGGGGGDTTPPTVSMTAPANNASVSGTVTVSANASDNVAVAGVQFKLDGNNLGAEDTTSPYSVSWNSSLASNGSHTLTAVARDSSGNTTTSSSLTVTVTGGTNTFNIGEINTLSNPDSGNGNLLIAQSASLQQAATIKSLSFYVTSAAGNLRLGIYDASGPNGGPGSLKAATAELTPTTGWNTAAVTSQVQLPLGTYWLAYLPSSNSLSFVNTADSSSSGKFYSYTYAALPATFSTSPSSTTSHWSFYATMDLGSGGGGPVPGDINSDGHVSSSDLTLLLANYGTGYPAADFNNNGIVDAGDFSVVLSHFGS